VRAAAELAQYARSVHLLLTAPTSLDTSLGDNLTAADHVDILQGYVPRAIQGDDYVERLIVESPTGVVDELAVDGVVIAQGLVRHSDPVAHLVNCDPWGAIMVSSGCATSRPGIFAAGDVTNVFSEQVLVAIGEGAKAALSAREYLLLQDWKSSSVVKASL
jgi:alkyl hydroperoxide reductase subunit F